MPLIAIDHEDYYVIVTEVLHYSVIASLFVWTGFYILLQTYGHNLGTY